jgi:hypothetical protein
MLKNGCGGVSKGSPLSLHLGELVVYVRDRKLGDVAQGRDHRTARNIEVVWITSELETGCEGTIRIKVSVEIPNVRAKNTKKWEQLLSWMGMQGAKCN